MRTRTLISSMLLLAFAAGGLAGYLIRAQKGDASLVLSAKDVITDEYIAPPDTFSRIKNTKNALDALSARVAIGIAEALAAHDRLPQTSESERRTADHVLAKAVQAGEAALQEFEGTEQQADMAAVFLRALRKAGQFNRWIEVYTTALYSHPTHRTLCDLAEEAVKISKAAGQQQSVLAALRYVIDSPAGFAGRAEVQAALTSAYASANVGAAAQNCSEHFFRCPQL